MEAKGSRQANHEANENILSQVTQESLKMENSRGRLALLSIKI